MFCKHFSSYFPINVSKNKKLHRRSIRKNEKTQKNHLFRWFKISNGADNGTRTGDMPAGMSSGNWVRAIKKLPIKSNSEFKWSRQWDSNPQPPPWQGGALANWAMSASLSRIGAGGQVRTGTSKGWSLSALAHLSYPRTTPPNKGEYRKYFMISNFSPRYTQTSSSPPEWVFSFYLPWPSFSDRSQQLHPLLHHWNWEHCEPQ